MSRAVNKRLSVVINVSEDFRIDCFWLHFGSNTNHTKRENTDDVYYIILSPFLFNIYIDSLITTLCLKKCTNFEMV